MAKVAQDCIAYGVVCANGAMTNIIFIIIFTVDEVSLFVKNDVKASKAFTIGL